MNFNRRTMVDGFTGLRMAPVARTASAAEAKELEELLVVQRPFCLCQYTPVYLDSLDAGRLRLDTLDLDTLDAPGIIGNIDSLGRPIAFCNVLAAACWVSWIPPYVQSFHCTIHPVGLPWLRYAM